MRFTAIAVATALCLTAAAGGPPPAPEPTESTPVETTPPPGGDGNWARLDDATDTAGVGHEGNGDLPGGADKAVPSDEPQDRYLRMDAKACATLSDIDTIEAIATTPGACPDGTNDVEIIPACDGTRLEALWVQRVAADGSFGDPEQLSDDECVTPADVAAAAQREFKSMKIATPEATLQGRPPMVVNVHYPAYTTATSQERVVALLSVPVVIRAEPVEFAWDFDDPYSAGSSTLVTTDPGRPWQDGDATPDQSWVGHTYSRLGTPGTDAGTDVDEKGNVYRSDVTVSLTTTWQGRFRVQGTSTWTDIPGTISTTSTTEPTTVTEARTRLVCDDLEVTSSC